MANLNEDYVNVKNINNNEESNEQHSENKKLGVRISEQVEEIFIVQDHFPKIDESTCISHNLPQYGSFQRSDDSTDDDSRSFSNNNVSSSSYTFRDGSFLTKSLIEPELETYFKAGSTWQSGILIMANVCLGMGILNFPRIVYEAGGLAITLSMLFVFVLLIIGSLYITAYCCRYYACVNYQDMVRVHCGRVFGLICSILLFMEVTGSLIVKMVALQDQLDRFYSIIVNEAPVKHAYFMPIAAIIFFLPMCFIRDFSCFKYVSIGGVLAACYITVGVAAIGYYKEDELPDEDFLPSNIYPRDFALIFPLLIYAYHGHVEVPLVFSSLKKHKLRHFMNTCYCYIFIATVCYSITAIFGYLTFGRLLNADFLLNYPNNNWYANVASFIVCFKLFTSFPVLFFVVRSVFSTFYTFMVRQLPLGNVRYTLEHYSIARTIQTLIVFSIIVLLAAIIPNISQAISFIGAVSCHFSFTFPGLCFFRLYVDAKVGKSPRKHVIRKYVGILYILLGSFFFGTNIWIAGQNLVKGGGAVL